MPSKGDTRSVETLSPDELAKRRRTKKASYIRRRIEAGDPVHDKQRAFLDAYDREVHGATGAAPVERPVLDPAHVAAPAVPPAPSDPPVPSAPVAAAAPAPAAPSSSPVVPAPAAPSPVLGPRTLPTGALAAPGRIVVVGGAGDWRAPYREAAKAGAVGRETACLKAAQLVNGLELQMVQALREVGVDPILDPDTAQHRAELVLAFDGWLPPSFQVTPEQSALVTGFSLMAQRLIHWRKIKEYTEAKKKKAATVTRLHSVPSEPVREPDAAPPVSSSPVREPDTAPIDEVPDHHKNGVKPREQREDDRKDQRPESPFKGPLS